MLNERILEKIASAEKSEILMALKAIEESKDISRDEASALAALICPYLNSNEMVLRVSAQRAVKQLKLLQPCLECPDEIRSEPVKVDHNSAERIKEKASTGESDLKNELISIIQNQNKNSSETLLPRVASVIPEIFRTVVSAALVDRMLFWLVSVKNVANHFSLACIFVFALLEAIKSAHISGIFLVTTSMLVLVVFYYISERFSQCLLSLLSRSRVFLQSNSILSAIGIFNFVLFVGFSIFAIIVTFLDSYLLPIFYNIPLLNFVDSLSGLTQLNVSSFGRNERFFTFLIQLVYCLITLVGAVVISRTCFVPSLANVETKNTTPSEEILGLWRFFLNSFLLSAFFVKISAEVFVVVLFVLQVFTSLSVSVSDGWIVGFLGLRLLLLAFAYPILVFFITAIQFLILDVFSSILKIGRENT